MEENSRLEHEKKVYCSENRKYIKELAKKDFGMFVGPVLTLDLTTACNYKCKHCIDYRLVQREKKREIDFELVCCLIKELYEKGCRNIELTGGGEPTMYSKFQEFCRYASKTGYHLALVTNGSNLGKLINIFDEIHFDWVRVSIDAIDPELYEEMHGISSEIMNDILNSIACITTKTDVGISYILSMQNSEDVYKALDVAQKLKVSYLEVKPLKNRDSGERGISDDEYMDLITQLKRKAHNVGVDLVYPSLCKKIECNSEKNKFVCWSSYLRTVLTPSGMYRCSYLRGRADKKPVPHNVEEFIKYRNELNNCNNLCYNIECSRRKLNEEIEKYITQLGSSIENMTEEEIEIKDGRWL